MFNKDKFPHYLVTFRKGSGMWNAFAVSSLEDGKELLADNADQFDTANIRHMTKGEKVVFSIQKDLDQSYSKRYNREKES